MPTLGLASALTGLGFVHTVCSVIKCKSVQTPRIGSVVLFAKKKTDAMSYVAGF